MRVYFRTGLFIVLLLAGLYMASAFADEREAHDMTGQCRITATENASHKRYLLSDNYRQYWTAGKAGELEIAAPAPASCQGVMISFFGEAAAMEALDAEGTRIGVSEGRFRTEWIPFDREVEAFRLRRLDAAASVQIARLHVLSPGRLPAWVQRWQAPDAQAELLVIATHPDDEILWFGGILPYYAGERQQKVMVAYMVGALNAVRTLELLDGLWTMGVTWYPDIGAFQDVGKDSVGSVYQHWGRTAAEERIQSLIQRYRPDVVLTQDVHGEYGHGAHVVTVRAVMNVFDRLAEDPSACGGPAPKKLYIHLWKENEIVFDWQQPLEAFHGRTALEVAKAAFMKHVSQQNGKYSVKDSGRFDCSRFGLYYSSVGPDEAKNDLFEHIPAGV